MVIILACLLAAETVALLLVKRAAERRLRNLRREYNSTRVELATLHEDFVGLAYAWEGRDYTADVVTEALLKASARTSAANLKLRHIKSIVEGEGEPCTK